MRKVMTIRSSGWWERHSISAKEDEEKVEIKGREMTTVMSVQVYPPPDRQDMKCYIYGHISFNDGPENTPVTFFKRDRDNPSYIVLGDYDFGRLRLCDGARPLDAASESNKLSVSMKLYEKKKEGSEKDDDVIADEQDHEFGRDVVDRCSFFDVVTTSGFTIKVCYAVVFGALAEVEVMIKEEGEEEDGNWTDQYEEDSTDQDTDEEEEQESTPEDENEEEEGGGDSAPGERKTSFPMWGHIAAHHFLKYIPNCTCGRSTTSLFYRYIKEAVTVNMDSAIVLDRKIVFLPMNPEQYLTISLTCVDDPNPIDLEALYDAYYVHLPLKSVTSGSFMTNKSLTHTKHVRGTMFTVSIRFIPD